MLNPGYTSIERVIENVIRDTGFTDEISFPDMVEWCFIAMELINVPNCYIQKITDGEIDRNHFKPVVIENYRGELPCDFHKLISVRDFYNKTPFREDTGTFLQSSNKPNFNQYSELTYTINNNYIFINYEEGELEISYWAFPTDEQGMPMIPNDVMYIRAIEAYLTERIGRKLWIQGKLARDVYHTFEQDWLFYVKAASVKNSMPTIDGMESLKNQITRMVQVPNQHNWQFTSLGNKEQSYVSRFNRGFKHL